MAGRNGMDAVNCYLFIHRSADDQTMARLSSEEDALPPPLPITEGTQTIRLSSLSSLSLFSTLYSLLSTLFSLLSTLFSLLSPLFSLLSSLLVLAHRRPPVECRHRTSYHHPSRCLFPPPSAPLRPQNINSLIPEYLATRAMQIEVPSLQFAFRYDRSTARSAGQYARLHKDHFLIQHGKEPLSDRHMISFLLLIISSRSPFAFAERWTSKHRQLGPRVDDG